MNKLFNTSVKIDHEPKQLYAEVEENRLDSSIHLIHVAYQTPGDSIQNQSYEETLLRSLYKIITM